MSVVCSNFLLEIRCSCTVQCIMYFSPHRGEKKPIPEDLKDEKYFERRKRNNLAAKKSRDQRKVMMSATVTNGWLF